MIFLTLAPDKVESFKQIMSEKGWEIAKQDAGQGHFIGWSYLIQWQKKIDDKIGEVTLHFSENQGVQESHLELNPAAKTALELILEQLN